jgi:hypothetical protein
LKGSATARKLRPELVHQVGIEVWWTRLDIQVNTVNDCVTEGSREECMGWIDLRSERAIQEVREIPGRVGRSEEIAWRVASQRCEDFLAGGLADFDILLDLRTVSEHLCLFSTWRNPCRAATCIAIIASRSILLIGKNVDESDRNDVECGVLAECC